MREQKSGLGPPQNGSRRRIQKQGSYQEDYPANPHRVGHYAGLHPEDQPYITTNQSPVIRQGYATSGRGNEEELEEDNSYYDTRLPTSARRYQVSPNGQVFRAGNRKIVVHYEEPPVLRRSREINPPQEQRSRTRFHPLVFVGLALFIMAAGYMAFSALGSWWQVKQDDWTYGQNPRTYQADVVVGHSDSSTSPTHFIALNLKGQIIIIELPGGDAGKARSYAITTIPGNSGNPPVKVVFQDLNRDAKLDMLVEIGDPGSYVTVILFNNGNQFVSKL